MNERDQELRELIALAAVGALDAGERTALDREIADRPDLLAELDELEGVAAAFADAVAEAPPEPLRARVLDAVADVPQLTAVERAAAEVVPLASRRRRWAPLAAAAAVVALLGGGLVARTLTTDDDTLDVAAVVDDDDAVDYPMSGTLPPLRVVHSVANDAIALVGDGLPVPEGDRVYELWLIAGGQPQRMDIFRPDDDGSVELLVLGPDVTDDAVFAITEEKAGGEDAPTGEILAASA